MKILSILATLAISASAIIALSLSFELTVSLLFATGFVAILVADYAHLVRPLRLQLAPAIVAERNEAFRLAA